MLLGPTNKDPVQLCKAAPHGAILPPHISVRVHQGCVKACASGGKLLNRCDRDVIIKRAGDL